MDFGLSLLASMALFAGLALLLWQLLIDLKLRLLPDELNLALLLTGIAFRFTTQPYSGTWLDACMGVILGGGILLLIRTIANRAYGFETMGLGDVKLLAAAGIWLGGEGVLYALMVGAFMGVAHGLLLVAIARLHGKRQSLRNMTIPAGPGFCAGIALVALYKFYNLPLFG